jgi:hypothetical protein
MTDYLDSKFVAQPETRVFEGRTFTRDADDRLDGASHFQADDDGVAPAIRCGFCFEATFQIRFGNYECIARCVACGCEGVIYDG